MTLKLHTNYHAEKAIMPRNCVLKKLLWAVEKYNASWERKGKIKCSLLTGTWFFKVCEAHIDMGMYTTFNIDKREPEERTGLSSTVAWVVNEGEGKGHSLYACILIYILNELFFSLSSEKIMRKYSVGITPPLIWSDRPPRSESSRQMCQCWAPGISSSRDQSSGWEFKRL